MDLFEAVSFRRIEDVKMLVNKENVNYIGTFGKTVIFSACYNRKKDIDILKILIEAGAEINITDEYKCTPLLWACKVGNSKTVKFLIDSGALIDVQNVEKKTPLICACIKSDIKIVRILLKAYSDKTYIINIQERYGNTALNYACINGNVDIVKILIKNGSFINSQNNFGNTSLMGTVDINHLSSTYNLSKKDYIKVIKELLMAGADTSIKNIDNNTALGIAYNNQDLKMINFLNKVSIEILYNRFLNNDLVRYIWKFL